MHKNAVISNYVFVYFNFEHNILRRSARFPTLTVKIFRKYY